MSEQPPDMNASNEAAGEAAPEAAVPEATVPEAAGPDAAKAVDATEAAQPPEEPPLADSVAAPASAALRGKPAAANQPERPGDFSTLPGYSRSLLKISVPVSVQLASKKESVQEVVGLAPGSIIKFEKGCEELLQMIVGEHTVAEGEAVKIGEKFGFRVIAMKLPPEHFAPIKKKQQRRRA